MRAKLPVVWFLILVACGCACAWADAAKSERKWKFVGGYDYYFPADSSGGMRTQLNFQADSLVSAGYNAAGYTIDTKGGTGARVGIMYPFADRVILGGTVGYVLGPTMNADFVATSGLFGNGGLTISRAVSYERLMGDMDVNLANSGRWSFDVDSGWGIGIGNVTQSCTASGSLTCPFENRTKTWVGFAWELSPAVKAAFKNATLTFAPRYAGFPYYRGNDQFPAIRWVTMGFSFGAQF